MIQGAKTTINDPDDLEDLALIREAEIADGNALGRPLEEVLNKLGLAHEKDPA